MGLLQASPTRDNVLQEGEEGGGRFLLSSCPSVRSLAHALRTQSPGAAVPISILVVVLHRTQSRGSAHRRLGLHMAGISSHAAPSVKNSLCFPIPALAQ